MKHSKLKRPISAALAVTLSLACFAPPLLADEADTNLAVETNASAPTNPPVAIEVAPAGSASHHRPQDIVTFGRTLELKAGEAARSLVVIGGSAIVHGRVEGDTVAIFGSVTVDGEVKGDTVAVLGNVRLGTNASVRGDSVAVGGNVRLSPGAKIRGDAVAVGGAVERSEGDEVGGNQVSLGGFLHLGDWLEQCVFKLRPLSFQVTWVWVVAGVIGLIYFLVALAFPWPVKVCVNELRTRPATTFLVGLLAKILVPVIVFILAATGVGLLAVPFLFVALLVGAIFGKVALLEQVGGGLGRLTGIEMLSRPLVSFLLGFVVLTLLYLVPIMGFVLFGLFGVWGLGAAVTALFTGMGRERKPPPPAPPSFNMTPLGSTSAFSATVPPIPTGGGTAEGIPPAAFAAAPASEPPIQSGQPVPLTYPRAGFWERMGAAFLDVMLLGITAALVGPFVLPVALAYFAGMWAWKGTTIGGIVLKLQVVRYDGGALTFPVALVRGLAAAFSVLVLMLGFFWIGWDPDKQGWHDKIAGTVVVRLPHSMPLICL